jgi:hypothetical protein
MQPDEAVLIRCFGSALYGPHRFSAHIGFDDPETPPMRRRARASRCTRSFSSRWKPDPVIRDLATRAPAASGRRCVPGRAAAGRWARFRTGEPAPPALARGTAGLVSDPMIEKRAGSWQELHATVPAAESRSSETASPRALFSQGSGDCRAGSPGGSARSGGQPCRATWVQPTDPPRESFVS